MSGGYAIFPNPFARDVPIPASCSACRPLAGRRKRIWTPRGERVAEAGHRRRLRYESASEVTWSGRREGGQTVYNGVYVAELVVRFDSGATERLLRNIAVVR